MNSNKKEDSLFLLIKSLTRNEKRFFTLYSKLFNQNKTPNYLHLFNILDNMSEYNQEFVLDELKKNTDNNHLPQIKRYLKVNLLESLKQYDKRNNDDIKRFNQILKIEVLFNKGFIDQGRKLAQNEKKAHRKDGKNLGTHLINMQLTKFETQQFKRHFKSHKQVKMYCLESIQLIEKQIEIVQIQEILIQIRILRSNKNKLLQEVNIELEKILQEKLLPLVPDTFKSFEAQLMYYNACSNIYMVLNQYNSCLETTNKQLALLLTPHFNQDIDDSHFVIRLNLLAICIKVKDFSRYQTIKKQLDELFSNYSFYKKRYIRWFYLRQLEYYFEIDASHLPENFITNLFKHIEAPPIDMTTSVKNGLLVSLAKYYLKKEQIENTRDTLLKITIEQTLSINDFYFLQIKVMNIICLYELNLQQIVNSEILSLKRKLRREDLLNAQLTIFLKLIKQLNNSNDKRKNQYYNRINTFIAERLAENDALFNKDLSFLSCWVSKKTL